MARKMTLGDKAVATAALAGLLEPEGLDQSEAWSFAEALVRAAEKAQYQASTRRLVITFDLSGPADVDEYAPDADQIGTEGT